MKLGGTLLIVDENIATPGGAPSLLRLLIVQGFNATSPIEIWGTENWRKHLGRRGMADAAIIGHARENDAIVLTHNRDDFDRTTSKENFAFAAPRPTRGRKSAAGGEHKEAIKVLWLKSPGQNQQLHAGEVVRRLINFDYRMTHNPQIWDEVLGKGGVIELT